MLPRRATLAGLGLAGFWLVTSATAEETLPADVQPFALPAATLLQQTTAPPARDKFPAVMLHDKQTYEFDDQQRLTLTEHKIYRIDDASAVTDFGQVRAVWDPSRQARPKIRARVVTKDGREHQFDPATLADESASDRDPLIFEDTRLLRGPLPAIAPGSVIEMEAIITDQEPMFAAGRTNQVYLAPSGAVERTIIIVSAPTSVPLRYAKRAMPQATVTDEVRDGRRIITVRQGPLALEAEKIFVEAAGDQPYWPEFQFSTGESWPAVAGAYGKLAEPFIRPDEVRSLLPKELPAERGELVASLLKILHERVRYTGVLFGQGKIVPNPPSVTLERRFGDCKDKAVVFVSLLRAAGLPAEVVLLNAGTNADVDPELPGVGNFNHMIVHVPGEQPLWIDATVEHMKVGELPIQDAGRWALLIGEDGAQLVRTPEPRPADEFRDEKREIRLTDFGPADMHVTGRRNGARAAQYRELWSAGNKAAEKRRDDLFKTIYSAKTVVRAATGEDPATGFFTYDADLKGITEAATNFDEANLSMNLWSLFSDMPYGLIASDEALKEPDPDDEDADDADADDKPKPPRTIDWVFEPFSRVLRIEVIPPPGFQLRALPENRELTFGPARLSKSFERDANGHAIATIRVDTGRGRYTADEGRAFRESFQKHEPDLSLDIWFDHDAAVLMSAGDEAGAVRRHAELTSAEPAKAIHRLRAAMQLLDLGLVEEARAEAQKATEIDPKSGFAFYKLGTVLESDDLGRRFGARFDWEGSIKAHREAIRLEPDKLEYILELAATAENNREGIRYGPGADLDLAIANYRKLVEKRPDWADGTGYLVQCMWHARQYAEIEALAAKFPDEQRIATVRLAARIMTAGATVALREDASRSDVTTHNKRVDAALPMLWFQRKYDQAREVTAASGAEARQGQNAFVMQLLYKIVNQEELPPAPATATGAAQSVMRIAIHQPVDTKALQGWISEKARLKGDSKWLVEKVADIGRVLEDDTSKYFGQNSPFLTDLILSNLEYKEPEAAGGAERITVQMNGAAVTQLYLVPENNAWRVLTIEPYWQPLGREALTRLDAGETAAATAWLDAVRDEIERDPNYETGRFKQFVTAWPHKPVPKDDAVIRLAAHTLLVGDSMVATSAEELHKFGPKLTTDAQRGLLQTLLYDVAKDQGDKALAVSTAEASYPEDPSSDDRLWLLASAYDFAGRWQDVERVSREWLDSQPNNEIPQGYLVESLVAQGRASEGLELLAAKVRRGRASPKQLNNYAWQALVADAVDDGVVSAAESSYNQQSRRNYASAHTLACVYAAAGRIADARKMLLQLFTDYSRVKADSGEIMLIRGLIAENLGATKTAIKIYRKIEKPKYSTTDSVYAIATSRLPRLEGSP